MHLSHWESYRCNDEPFAVFITINFVQFCIYFLQKLQSEAIHWFSVQFKNSKVSLLLHIHKWWHDSEMIEPLSHYKKNITILHTSNARANIVEDYSCTYNNEQIRRVVGTCESLIRVSRWKAVDIYPPLFTSPSGDSCILSNMWGLIWCKGLWYFFLCFVGSCPY